MPRVLPVRARVPGKGDPHRRPSGAGAAGALHRLRRLRQGVHAGRQARAVGGRGGRDAARRARRRSPQSSRRASRPSSSATTTRRWSARCGRWGSPRSTRWRSARNWWRTQYRRLVAEDTDASVDRHDVPGGRRLRAPLHPGADPVAGANRLADDRDGAAAARRSHGDACASSSSGPASPRSARRSRRTSAGEVDEALTFAELRQMLTARGLDLDAVVAGRLRPAARPRRRPVPHQRRHAAGGRHPGRPRHRPRDGRRGPGRVRAGHQGSRDGHHGDAAARAALLQGLHDGAGHELGPAALRPPRARQPVRAPPHRHAWTLGEWAANTARWIGPRSRRARTRRSTCACPCRRPKSSAACSASLGKSDPHHELNCGACGYSSCRELASAIYVGLAEPTMCLPYSIEQLRSTVRELAHLERRARQRPGGAGASEKLASMGQLAAGIAHEVNNPLGVVIMYAHFLMEQLGDRPEVPRRSRRWSWSRRTAARRSSPGCSTSRARTRWSTTAINLAELVQKALRGVPPPVNVQLDVDSTMADPMVEVDPDQLTQVLINLVTNAYAAMPDGGTLRGPATRDDGRALADLVVDRHGRRHPARALPEALRAVLHDEEGAARARASGLAVTYGIVKMHRGDIKVPVERRPREGADRHDVHRVPAAAPAGRPARARSG